MSGIYGNQISESSKLYGLEYTLQEMNNFDIMTGNTIVHEGVGSFFKTVVEKLKELWEKFKNWVKELWGKIFKKKQEGEKKINEAKNKNQSSNANNTSNNKNQSSEDNKEYEYTYFIFDNDFFKFIEEFFSNIQNYLYIPTNSISSFDPKRADELLEKIENSKTVPSWWMSTLMENKSNILDVKEETRTGTHKQISNYQRDLTYKINGVQMKMENVGKSLDRNKEVYEGFVKKIKSLNVESLTTEQAKSVVEISKYAIKDITALKNLNIVAAEYISVCLDIIVIRQKTLFF